MSTGSAPISSEVFEFLRVCFGATVSEGYGMTESACTIAMTRPDDATIGHVGAPLECCEIKLEDIPDMNYKNTDQPCPRGEVKSSVSCLAVSLPEIAAEAVHDMYGQLADGHTESQNTVGQCVPELAKPVGG